MKKIVYGILLSSSSVFAQGTLKGIVKEEGSRQPLVGAHIAIKDSNQGAITNRDGQFTIPSINSGKYLVEISFVGYYMQTLPVEIGEGVSSLPEVLLTPGNIQLADVVITSGTDRPLNTLSPVDINLRPTNTSQDILRMVPGLFIAQHAGGGKAEQIFLRGFDIDHGTDINLEVDGLPVNMVSHAHGQGYSDLHFLIPELVQYVDFDKGPYFANKGDFTTAGYVDFQTKTSLEGNFVKVEGAQFGTLRTVAGVNLVSRNTTKNTGYIASEYFRSDGFFESPQHFNRFNLAGKYTIDLGKSHYVNLGSTYFRSSWDASGQIPERAVRNGTITRFGSIDDTEGGQTSRANFFIKHRFQFGRASFDQQAYAVYYDFNLYSNFTFLLADPVNGDQIQQQEARMIYGYKVNYHTNSTVFGRELNTQFGGGVRFDDVREISLSNTLRRQFLGDIQRGDLTEGNANIFVNETLALNRRWSINSALRFDYFTFEYDDKLTAQQGSETASIVSPKLSINYQASENTLFYIRSGTGFHSNDARVVVERNAREILPRAYGIDIGMHTKLWDKLLLHSALWRLDLDQEFVYVGDAGIVEASGKTQRQGLDLSARYQVLPWLFADVDLTLADPKAKGALEGENYIPLAPTFSSVGGLSVRSKTGINGSLRYRWLTDRAANEANIVMADGYFLMDAMIAFTQRKFEIAFSVENVLNMDWNEAQFDTESRLAGETDPISEIHFTPGSPRFTKLKVAIFF